MAGSAPARMPEELKIAGIFPLGSGAAWPLPRDGCVATGVVHSIPLRRLIAQRGAVTSPLRGEGISIGAFKRYDRECAVGIRISNVFLILEALFGFAAEESYLNPCMCSAPLLA